MSESYFGSRGKNRSRAGCRPCAELRAVQCRAGCERFRSLEPASRRHLFWNTGRSDRIDDEYCRLGNATLLLGIIDAPIFDHLPFGIAQNRKRQPEFAPHSFGFDRWIDGYGHHIGPGRADFCVMIAVIRQLAETEWSPGAAIEKKHQTVSRN